MVGKEHAALIEIGCDGKKENQNVILKMNIFASALFNFLVLNNFWFIWNCQENTERSHMPFTRFPNTVTSYMIISKPGTWNLHNVVLSSMSFCHMYRCVEIPLQSRYISTLSTKISLALPPYSYTWLFSPQIPTHRQPLFSFPSHNFVISRVLNINRIIHMWHFHVGSYNSV